MHFYLRILAARRAALPLTRFSEGSTTLRSYMRSGGREPTYSHQRKLKGGPSAVRALIFRLPRTPPHRHLHRRLHTHARAHLFPPSLAAPSCHPLTGLLPRPHSLAFAAEIRVRDGHQGKGKWGGGYGARRRRRGERPRGSNLIAVSVVPQVKHHDALPDVFSMFIGQAPRVARCGKRRPIGRRRDPRAGLRKLLSKMSPDMSRSRLARTAPRPYCTPARYPASPLSVPYILALR
jgi:hypothetical protein